MSESANSKQMLLRVYPKNMRLIMSWLDQNVLGVSHDYLTAFAWLDIRICKHDKRREAFASRAFCASRHML